MIVSHDQAMTVSHYSRSQAIRISEGLLYPHHTTYLSDALQGSCHIPYCPSFGYDHISTEGHHPPTLGFIHTHQDWDCLQHSPRQAQITAANLQIDKRMVRMIEALAVICSVSETEFNIGYVKQYTMRLVKNSIQCTPQR
jgi:hypothetical protein